MKYSKLLFICLAISVIISIPLFWQDMFSLAGNFKLTNFYMRGLFFLFIALAVFSFSSFLFVIIAKLEKKKISPLTMAAPTLLIIMSILTVIGNNIPRKFPPGSNMLKFDSTIWNKDTFIEDMENQIAYRQKMLRDLVQNILPGKTKEEVINLLGEPDNQDLFPVAHLCYYLGLERASVFKLKSESLLICFDENGKFEKYEIIVE